MKCQMCNGEGGKIHHPENYGSYREDCPTCNGTGKQTPVDRLLRFEEYMEKTQGTSADNVYWEAHAYVATLEAELDAARGALMEKIVAEAGWECSQNSIKYHIEQNEQIQAENERYLAAIKTFYDRSKWAVEAWKKQDYIAALFEIANQESR